MTAFLETLSILTAGLFAGGIACIAWERTPRWAAMGLSEFTADFTYSVKRMDPAMPILGVVAAVLTLTAAVGQSGTERIVGLVGAILILVVIVVSVAVLEPINLRFRRIPIGEIPEAAAAMRARWVPIHRFRALVSVLAFGCIVAMATIT